MRFALAAVAVLLIAATPADVVPDLRTQGFFIEEGSDADPAAVGDAVAEARFADGRLNVVVLAAEPPGGATAFSDAVLDDLGSGTVFVVGPETIGYASFDDVWSTEELDEAVDAAASGGSDTEVVELFVASLTTGSGAGSAGGGSLWPFLLVGLAIAAVVAGAIWWSKQQKVARQQQQLGKLQALIGAKVDDVANDIIDLEDEVSTSGNQDAERYYEEASSTYADTLGRSQSAKTVGELIELSNRLDEAIWQLDSAEAVLDGKPLPVKPEPMKPVPEEPEPEAAAVAPAPDAGYTRRPSRRSSYRGPDVSNALMTMMAMGAMSGGRRRRSNGSGGRQATSSGRRRTSSRRRSRGGARRRG